MYVQKCITNSQIGELHGIKVLSHYANLIKFIVLTVSISKLQHKICATDLGITV